MSETPEEVGKMIRAVRKSKGVTQKELGEKLGVSEATVNKYENDNQNMTIRTLKKIADALGAKLTVMIK